jgi:hypothetical protein
MVEASRPNLCDVRLIHSIIINVLFIGAGNVSVVWKRFLLQDYAIEHRFVSGETEESERHCGASAETVKTILL